MAITLDRKILSGNKEVRVYTVDEINTFLTDINRLTERATKIAAGSSGQNQQANWLQIFGKPAGQVEWEQETSIESYEDEKVDDRVNQLLLAGTGFSKVYDDTNNTLTLNVDNPFDPNGTYANLRAQATTFGDVGAYSTSQIDNFFSGTTSITGYNKGNWDDAFTNALRANDVWGTGTQQTVATEDDVEFSNGIFNNYLSGNYGINGGFAGISGTGGDWGATIWGMGKNYSGGAAGSGYNPLGGSASAYNLSWLRGGNTNAAHGEGLYIYGNNTLIGAVGTAKAFFVSDLEANIFSADRFDLRANTEALSILDGGSVGATEQDWVKVTVGGTIGYIRIYATK